MHKSGLQVREKFLQERVWLRTMFDQVADYLFVKDTRCRFVLANRAIAADLGLESADSLIGKTDLELHPFPVAMGFFRDERQVLRTGIPLIDKEECIIQPNGARRWFASSKYPLRDDDGNIVGLFGVCRDITERRKADGLRDAQAHVLEMIASSAPLSDVLECMVRLIEGQLDGAICSVLLLDEDGRHLRHGAAPSLPKAYCDAIDGVEIGPSVGSCGTAAYTCKPVTVADIQADPLWADYHPLATKFGLRCCWSTPIMSLDNRVLGTFAIYKQTPGVPGPVEDRLIADTARIAAIAIERKRAEEKIRFLAHHDPLTSLPNRSQLESFIDAALARVHLPHERVAVVFVDLDNFKTVNDSLGHAAGDRLLLSIAARLSDEVQDRGKVLRLGGDEFVLILEGSIASSEELPPFLRGLREKLSLPVHLAGQSFHVTSSMGAACYPDDATEAAALVQCADTAMYTAKRAGRNTFHLYSPVEGQTSSCKLQMLEGIRRALRNNEFILHYQPQVDLVENRITGFEGLVRWENPFEGLIMPRYFVPLMEEAGLICELGHVVLGQAVEQARLWQEQGFSGFKISINIAPQQFSDPDWTQTVMGALKQAGLRPGLLELEITEGVLMQNVERAVAVMAELHALGVGLAIDDFGKGHSSLASLRRFPVSRLKIDEALVRHIDRDESDRGIAETVVTLGQKLKLRVIAEGVEREAQVEALRAIGCPEAQGYFLGMPMTADEATALLEAQG
ncbi:sensor domain-containing protein [Pannonibacter phragmitetus]|uniref:sensor domain-containing protein n=1 Tax=Pannonibacter phragmitetus TaxID=121719 RepID=UPI001364AD8C|nr:EAL domain-containing protein [Pannonibacter phragmitetus]